MTEIDSALHHVNTFSFILSAAAGILLGLVIGFYKKRPRSVGGLIAAVVVGALSPWILISGWAFAYSHDGETYGVNISRGLLFFCGTLILVFAIRRLKKSPPAAA